MRQSISISVVIDHKW